MISNLLNKLKHPALAGLIQDQHLKELLIHREFRLSEEYLHREFISQAADDEIHSPELRFFDGFGEIRCQVKKRLLPAISFSARFTVQGVEFSSMGKRVHLRVEQVKPFDFDWVTRRFVEKVPFLSFSDGLLTCDLTRVPRLANLFSYQIKGFRVADLITLKELTLQDGEIVGRLGMVL